MNTLFKLYLIICLSLLADRKRADAQIQPAESTSVDYTKGLILDSLLENYSNTLNYLILEDRYQDVIEVAEPILTAKEQEINQLPIPYLICAYYFTNNIEKSKKLLDQKISKLDYKELIDLLTDTDIPLIRYFNVPENREQVIEKAINDYRKKERATDKDAGAEIIRFLINDQRARKVKYAYRSVDHISQAKVERELKMQDSIQNANIYAFYEKHGKYFSKREVGESVSWYQPIILSHYDNIRLRQTFFKDLLEKAVKEDRMEKTNYVNFLLRTESFTDPEFIKNLEKRTEEVRKEFDLPDYHWNPF